SIGTLYEKITKGDYQPASTYNLTVSPAVDGIITRCLKRNPAHRYQSADELLLDVARAIGTGSSSTGDASGRIKAAPLDFARANWHVLAVVLAGGVLLLLILYFLMA